MGYTHPLYVLPFDHRASSVSVMFGWSGAFRLEQIAQITDAKRVIYEGFAAAVAGGVGKDKAGISVDAHFGAEILRDAKRSGIISCVPAQRGGQDEFDFEFGGDFARHIRDFAPTFCKVLVRCILEGDIAVNQRQVSRLRSPSDVLVGSPCGGSSDLLGAACRLA